MSAGGGAPGIAEFLIQLPRESERESTGTWTRTLLLDTGRTISGFGQDAAGEVDVVDYSGIVLKLVPQ
jgi:hypothetical protein